MSIIPKIDLRDRLGPVRDQGQRPTCIVFATSAAHEAHRQESNHLSPEYLFFAGAQRSHKDPTRGLTSDATRSALVNDGQPDEQAWPYSPTTPESATWRPPSGQHVMHTGTIDFKAGTVGDLKLLLHQETTVVLVMEMTIAMHRVKSDGIVRILPNDVTTSSHHALLAVGYGSADDGDYILVRNSWGSRWGDNGHGWLHEPYLNTCLQFIGLMV
jgi:C1A family cysteine protease